MGAFTSSWASVAAAATSAVAAAAVSTVGSAFTDVAIAADVAVGKWREAWSLCQQTVVGEEGVVCLEGNHLMSAQKSEEQTRLLDRG